MQGDHSFRCILSIKSRFCNRKTRGTLAKGKKGPFKQIAVLRWPLGTMDIYNDNKYTNHFSLGKKPDFVRVNHSKCMAVYLGAVLMFMGESSVPVAISSKVFPQRNTRT